MFTLRGKKVFLYGNIDFNHRTRDFFENVGNSGAIVCGIIDNNPEKHSDKPLCISFDTFCKTNTGEKDDYVFLLCFWSGDTAEKVAKELYDVGFCNLVFPPLDCCYDLYYSRLLRRFFNHLKHGMVLLDEKIPTYEELLQNRGTEKVIYCFSQNGGKSTDNIEAWIPIEYIYSDNNVNGSPRQVPFCDMSKLNIPISEYHDYIELYDFVIGEKKEYPSSYLKHNGTDLGRKPDELLRDRVKLYNQMKYWLKNDPSFFCDEPVSLRWNKKEGHFNIIDGTHRTSFLYCSGWNEIPAVMTILDYRDFMEIIK